MIVPKEEIRYVFNEYIMLPGDILLMNTYESQRRLMPSCIYDHAGLYLGDTNILEADGLGVVINHVYSYAFKEKNHGCILRLKDNERPKNMQDLITWARGQLGMEYSVHEARRARKQIGIDEKCNENRTFCSRLVAQAYQQIGINIVGNPNFCSPDEILNSDKLEKLEPSLQEFSEEMCKTVMNGQEQRANSEWNTTLQELFQALGQFYNVDIHTIDQLLIAAINNPDVDEGAVKILKEQRWMISPYEQTKMIWPWFNDDDNFFSHFSSIQDALFFIRNQILHYDKTYLPIFTENNMNTFVMSRIRKDSNVLKEISRQFKCVLDEAIRVRKRLEDLYLITFDLYPDEFTIFCDTYGFERNYEYKDCVLDISKILNAILINGVDVESLLKE